ncbi:hypothetical protein [Hymenobacter armeniacus]|uniref:Uncharacterized protein n=1 Tax=Hymenobacter armeniacus TaxID=2771358 RepID=A0ABR8JWH5_9BACT|nr:hypothetical protein [Hymenobacter armeniacus]MBD2723455.1 hypothetical protein [Hymenobacter armeniacus]
MKLVRCPLYLAEAMRVFSSAVALLALIRLTAAGQAPVDATVNQSVATVQRQYAVSFVGHPELFSGSEYVDYAKRYYESIRHQFFLTPEAKPGGVQYNGQYFANQQLTYDVVLDQVVLRLPASPLQLRLLNEKVEHFTIGGHYFVRYVADSVKGENIRTGYYEVLNEGRTQLLARRAKRKQENIAQRQITVKFLPAERLFLKKGGVFFLVKSKRAALKVLADKNKEVQQYLRDQKLGFKRAQFETSLRRLTDYYKGLPQ